MFVSIFDDYFVLLLSCRSESDRGKTLRLQCVWSFDVFFRFFQVFSVFFRFFEVFSGFLRFFQVF